MVRCDTKHTLDSHLASRRHRKRVETRAVFRRLRDDASSRFIHRVAHAAWHCDLCAAALATENEYIQHHCEMSPDYHDKDTTDTASAHAERVAGHFVERPSSIDTDSAQPDVNQSKFRYLSARDLASVAEKGLQRTHNLGEQDVTRAAGFADPAVDAAKRVGRLPTLAALTGLGGKRAPADDSSPPGADPPPPSDNSNVKKDPLNKQGLMSRTVFTNDDPKISNFFSIYISTTKSSLLTSIPLFLIEQFSRFSNAYFLTAVPISSLTPGGAMWVANECWHVGWPIQAQLAIDQVCTDRSMRWGGYRN